MNALQLFLLSCLKRDPDAPSPEAAASLAGEDWHALLHMAKIQRVLPLLCHRLQKKHLAEYLPEPDGSAMRNAVRETTMRNLRFLGELAILSDNLKPRRIPMIVLKGMYLANAVYEHIGLREMNDIDILVGLHHLHDVAAHLIERGYAPYTDRHVSEDLAITVFPHLPRMGKDGAAFEIHGNLTAPDRGYGIDPAELWARSIPVHWGKLDALALSPEDMLLHLCLHASYQHGFAFGLRPFCDIDAFLVRLGTGLDWQAVLDRTERWGWGRGVYLTLRLARDMMDAPVPAGVLQRLLPGEGVSDILATAIAQVFTDSRASAQLPQALAHLIVQEGLTDKIRIFLGRVLLPRRVMATMYPAAPDSWRILLYYPLRAMDLLRRYSGSFRRAEQGDAELVDLAHRKRRIDVYLMNR